MPAVTSFILVFMPSLSGWQSLIAFCRRRNAPVVTWRGSASPTYDQKISEKPHSCTGLLGLPAGVRSDPRCHCRNVGKMQNRPMPRVEVATTHTYSIVAYLQ